MATRDDITRELLAGVSAYQLTKKYPKSSVYEIKKELEESGQLGESGSIVVDAEGDEVEAPFVPAPPPPLTTPPTASTTQVKTKIPSQTGAEVVSFPGERTLPADAVNRIRGILGISLRPKVLSCPMPELLYPAMVIAVTELGFQPMRPDDFIDTVLYQWLEACDYVPFAYLKRSELEEYASKYSAAKETTTEQTGNVKKEDDIPKDLEHTVETESEPEDVIELEMEVKPDEPHKPTVGDFLGRLHINNIQNDIQEEVEDDSAGRTEPANPQSNNEPRE